jgi:hypothetical protein
VEEAAAHHEMLRRRLDVQDAAARGHPLGVTVGDPPAAAIRVLVVEDAVDHVRDRLEPAVRVPRRALGLTGRVVDLAHLIQVDERVQLGHRHTGERAAHRKALALEAARRGGQMADRPVRRGGRVELRQAGEDEHVLDGDGGHRSGLSWSLRMACQY